MDFNASQWDQASEPGNVDYLVAELRKQFNGIDESLGEDFAAYLLTRMQGNRPTEEMLKTVEQIKKTIQQTVSEAKPVSGFNP